VVEQIVKIVEDETKAGTAHPISDDVPTLVRTLAATTGATLSGDSSFVGTGRDVSRAVAVLERLWLYSLWGGGDISAG
jgi:hypothetical protein